MSSMINGYLFYFDVGEVARYEPVGPFNGTSSALAYAGREVVVSKILVNEPIHIQDIDRIVGCAVGYVVEPEPGYTIFARQIDLRKIYPPGKRWDEIRRELRPRPRHVDSEWPGNLRHPNCRYVVVQRLDGSWVLPHQGVRHGRA